MPFYLRKLMAQGGYMSEATNGEEAGGAGVADKGQEEQSQQDQQDQQGQQDVEDVDSMKARLATLEQENASLLKDAMKKKEKLKAFGDVTPEKVQQLLAAEQERLAREQEEETRRLEEKGQWDALKSQMVEQHETELQGLRGQVEQANNEKAALQKQIIELTVGQSFSNSSFLREKTVLPATKARVLYGSHFEVNEQGQVIGYNKPAGCADRAPLVDAQGEPVGFEDAISRIIAADTDADHILRSSQKAGANSMTDFGIKPGQESQAKTIEQKLSSGLAKLMK